MLESIPSTMKAIVAENYCHDLNEAIAHLKVGERPVPAPKRGQVLVRVEAAPCNPSDLIFLQGKYGVKKALPTVPGWEGAGTVVATGGGWLATWLSGKRVACGAQRDGDGTWAEYVVVNASECIPLKRQIEIKQGASLIINPLTAMALLETAQQNGHRAAIQTGGASQLGRMLIRMAVKESFPLVSIVRRHEQVELLRSNGATHVLNSSDENFLEQFKTLCEELSATAAFDAVGGEMTGNLINAMPVGSIVYVYGALSEEACGNLDPVELIFHNKTVTGFFLGNWLKTRGALGVLRTANRVQKMLISGEISTSCQREITLDEVHEGLTQYVNNMTVGKVLFRPHGRTAT